ERERRGQAIVRPHVETADLLPRVVRRQREDVRGHPLPPPAAEDGGAAEFRARQIEDDHLVVRRGYPPAPPPARLPAMQPEIHREPRVLQSGGTDRGSEPLVSD